MARMNSRNREKWYEFLVKRDGGECCNVTKVPGNKLTLVIDHIDGNDAHNPKDGSNYQLVTRRINLLKSQNLLKNNKGGEQSPVSVCVGLDEGLQGSAKLTVNSAEMARNMEAEPAFREYLYLEMVAEGQRDLAEFIPEAAEKARCSPETIRQRYLPKVVSKLGFFKVEKEATEDGKTQSWIRWREQHKHHCFLFNKPAPAQARGSEQAAVGTLGKPLPEKASGTGKPVIAALERT